MTKTAVDYNMNNSVIYRIKCKDGSCIYTYTGSSANFTQRKAAHKHNCNNADSKKYNLLVYQTIRANGGWSEWEMVIIEIFPCESKQHLCVREQWHIEQQDEERLNYKKVYYDANRTQLITKKKLYNDSHFAERKAYREANKVIINEKSKAYRDANREMINEKQREKKLSKKESQSQ
jgi:hypothetical protein